MPDPRPPERLNLTKEQMVDIMFIVDRKQMRNQLQLDKVTPRNLPTILREAEREYSSLRTAFFEKEQLFSEERTPLQAADIVLGMQSQTHAIQCALGEIRDFKQFINYWDAHTEVNPPADAAAARDVRQLATEHIRHNLLLRRLYLADVCLRIAVDKGDDELQQMAYRQFQEVAPDLLELLDTFHPVAVDAAAETANTAVIARVMDTIRCQTVDSLSTQLYDQICVPFSQLTFRHFRDLRSHWQDQICQATGLPPGTRQEHPYYLALSQ